MEKCDLYKDDEEARKYLTYLIHNNWTIQDIANLYKEPPYVIINKSINKEIELDKNVLNTIKNHYNNYKIDENRCLIISDTHIGRTTNKDFYNNSRYYSMNDRLLWLSYEYAQTHNIKHIIHCGDLLEGKCFRRTPSLEIEQQIEYLKYVYPFKKEKETLLLYGNHDYNLIYWDKVKLYEIIKKMNCFELIGINHSYLLFGNNFLKISHYCQTAQHIHNINSPYDFELAGHSHTFSINESSNKIYIPTLACELEYDYNIGFIEMINEENSIVLKRLNKKANQIDEKVLKKNKK